MVDALAPDRSDQPFGEAGDFAEVQGGRHAYALVAKGIFTPALPNSRRAAVSCMRRAPQLGLAPQGLPVLRRRAIPGHRGADADHVPRAFREDVARGFDAMSPGARCPAGA